MTNPYFNNTNDLIPTTRIRAGDVESNFSAVGAGFDAVKVDMDTKAPSLSPTFTGTPSAPTPPVGDASSRLATMAALASAINAAAAINLPTPSGDGKSLNLQGGAPVWGTWFGQVLNLTSASTLENRRMYSINSSAGAFDLTLPTPPASESTWVYLVDVGGNLESNPVTLLYVADKIMHQEESLDLDVSYQGYFFIHEPLKGWYLA